MNAFKVSISRIITGFYQRFKAGLHKSTDTAAENSLFAEQVGLGLGAEGGFENTGTCAANAERIRKTNIECVAGSVLLNGNQARNALPARYSLLTV